MVQALSEMFSYGFIVNALIVGSLVAVCSALLGVSLVLKRYSMIGDGLSHVGFGAVSIAMAANLAPLAVSIPAVIMAAFLLLRLSEGRGIRGDAAIGLIASAALAAGVIVTSLSSGLNADVYSYLFGSVLAMSPLDVYLSGGVASAVLLLFIVFYNKIFAVTFDEPFARATGVHARAYNTILALLTAMTIVVGMRMMGAMLISGLVVFPAVSAMRVCSSFRGVTVCAAALSVTCFVAGIVLSYAFGTPAGASVVAVNTAAFAACYIMGKTVSFGRRALRKS